MKIDEVTQITELNDSDYILITLANGNLARIKKASLYNQINAGVPFTGSEMKSKTFNKRGWYRICIGGNMNNIASAIINIGNLYNTISSKNVCFHFWGSAYTSGFGGINILGKTTDNIFTKIRFLHKLSTTERSYIDLYYNLTTANTCYLALSNSLNLRLHNMDFVEDNDIPDGYSVKEFSL